jgi:hypothetical protein
MISYWNFSKNIIDNIFIPKFYDPFIINDLKRISDEYSFRTITDLELDKIIEVSTGDEIGKSSYGTGDIPFVRTSDISNWEIKSAPKQGVSADIYEHYSKKQDVKEGDVLLVRDGTYLIGTNCFITKLDEKIIYQSHILKFRIINKVELNPIIFFIALNSDLVQKQIRAIQFTADIIDTIGNRYKEIKIPIPKCLHKREIIINSVQKALETRVKEKAFIKQCPLLIEESLLSGQVKNIDEFLSKELDELTSVIIQDTISAEFGKFEAFWIKSNDIRENILLPKYYDPSIDSELSSLNKSCDLLSLGLLKELGYINYHTGDEIGKMAYGTGDIPFFRTSDFANWELKHDPKQGISEEIYKQYMEKENVQVNDIFLVRDGTYLIGATCIITEEDSKSLFCGGLYKLSVIENDLIDAYLLLGLLNSYIVKRQIRTKQFTRDVIDTLGNRIDEVIIPIPKSIDLRNKISNSVRKVISDRIDARNLIKKITNEYATNNTTI